MVSKGLTQPERDMKTFTSIEKFPEGSVGHDQNIRQIYIVEADPKREGLYKATVVQTSYGDDKARSFSHYYGKCNQEKILEMTKTMIEVL